jgi:hypothetical protein
LSALKAELFFRDAVIMSLWLWVQGIAKPNYSWPFILLPFFRLGMRTGLAATFNTERIRHGVGFLVVPVMRRHVVRLVDT